MFAATLPDGSPVTVSVSFWQAVKVGVGFTLGALSIPIFALVIQVVTKIPLVTYLAFLPRL